MANKHLRAKLGSVGDLARQYRELCELRVELERRTSRLEQSRPRHGRPTATDRPSGAEPKHLIFDGWTPRTISKKGRVARLNGENGAGSSEADGEPWPTLAARSAATAKSKPAGSSSADRLSSVIKCVRTAVEVIGAENPARLAELIAMFSRRAMMMTHKRLTATHIDRST